MASTISAPPPVLSRSQTSGPDSTSPYDGSTQPAAPLLPLTPEEIEAIKLVGEEDSRHWTNHKKWSTTIIISLMGFISPLGSSILVPGSAFVDHSFSLDSRTLSVLPVSVFVLGLGVGPFILAPWSETVGRHPVYVVTSAVFIAFNLGSAFSPNFVSLNILRFFAGAAGSTGPSLGAGSIGDMFAPRERGRAQSLYGLGPLMGPVIGSIIGGFIADSQKDWRWLIHTLTIMSAVIFVIIVLFLNETYSPVLLRHKREKAIKDRLQQIKDQDPVTATAILPKKTLWQRLSQALARARPSNETLHKMKIAQSRPFRLLFTNPICAIFSSYLGFCYGIIYLFLTQHPLLFQKRDQEPGAPPPDVLPTYNWNLGVAGLSYLGLGLGFLVAAFTNAVLQDNIYARLVITDGRIGWFLFKDKFSLQRYMDELRYQEARAQSGGLEEADSSAMEDGAVTPYSMDIPVHATSEEKQAAHHASTQFGVPSHGERSASTEIAATPLAGSPPPEGKLAESAAAAPLKKGRPEYRLPLCLVGMLILPTGMFTFGWSAETQTHWIVPLIGSFLVGYATILCFQTILVYLVDAFVPYSASATACAVLIRSVLAAAFPLVAEEMFEALGYAWSCSLLAFIGMLGIPAPLILYRYGEHLRLRYQFKG